jgi:hypothetical protein
MQTFENDRRLGVIQIFYEFFAFSAGDYVRRELNPPEKGPIALVIENLLAIFFKFRGSAPPVFECVQIDLEPGFRE